MVSIKFQCNYRSRSVAFGGDPMYHWLFSRAFNFFGMEKEWRWSQCGINNSFFPVFLVFIQNIIFRFGYFYSQWLKHFGINNSTSEIMYFFLDCACFQKFAAHRLKLFVIVIPSFKVCFELHTYNLKLLQKIISLYQI